MLKAALKTALKGAKGAKSPGGRQLVGGTSCRRARAIGSIALQRPAELRVVVGSCSSAAALSGGLGLGAAILGGASACAERRGSARAARRGDHESELSYVVASAYS